MRLKGLLILMLAFVFVLSGCWYGETKTDTTINTIAGAGTRTITVEVWNDDVAKPDGNGNVDDNTDYFPAGLDPVITWLDGVTPNYVTVTKTTTATTQDINLTFSFSDFNDFKAKSLELTGKGSFTVEPTLTAVDATGGSNVTFTEDKSTVSDIVLNYFGQLYVEDTIFDPMHGTGDPGSILAVADVFRINSYTTTVGDNSESFDVIADNAVVLTTTGFVAADAVPNPETGDQGYAMYAILAALASATVAWLFVNRRKQIN